MSGLATRIDISAELEAIARGECPSCRIGATHKRTGDCDRTPPSYDMACCPECGTMWAPAIMRGEYVGVGCPMCHERARFDRAA